MKTLLTAMAALLLTVSAKASTLTANDSWETILASNDYLVRTVYPSFGPNGIFNACATDTEIKAVSPVSVCVETKYVAPRTHNDMPSEVCVRTEQRITSIPRSGTASVCQEYNHKHNGDGSCIRWADEAYEVALTQNLEVITLGRHYPATAFTKNYTIPACN